MDTVTQLRPFLEPQAVAVVGANPGTVDRAFNIVEALRGAGYAGQVHPVNPKYREISGKDCYSSVGDVPGEVDLAIVMAPRGAVPDIVRQCGEKGIRAAVVVGGGFAEADAEGKRLQRELLEAGRRAGVRILGPNTVGSANAFIGFSTSFVRQINMRRIPVGVISQSGLFFGTVGRLRLLGKGLDLGNACDVDVSEALEYFGDDPEVRVIALHLEGVSNGPRFREAAQRVTRKKPVVALKTGRSECSGRVAQSHTGSLIGREEIWDAVLKQSGVIRAGDIDELADLVGAFRHLPLMAGRGIGVATAMGGVGVLAVDACTDQKLDIVDLSPETIQRLNDMGPPWFNAVNPLDVWTLMTASRESLGETFRAALREVLSDHNVSGVLLFAGAWFRSLFPSIIQVITELATAFPDKPIAWCPYYGWQSDVRPEHLEDMLEDIEGVAVFPTPEGAVRALAALADYREYLSAGP